MEIKAIPVQCRSIRSRISNDRRTASAAVVLLLAIGQWLGCGGSPPPPSPATTTPSEPPPPEMRSWPGAPPSRVQFADASGFYCTASHCFRTMVDCQLNGDNCVPVPEVYCFLVYQSMGVWQSCYRTYEPCDAVLMFIKAKDQTNEFKFSVCEKTSQVLQPPPGSEFPISMPSDPVLGYSR